MYHLRDPVQFWQAYCSAYTCIIRKGRCIMIDFILAGLVYLGVMFVVFFCFSFVTVGITYLLANTARRCTNWMRQPRHALK